MDFITNMDAFLIPVDLWNVWKSECRAFFSSEDDTCVFLESAQRIEKRMTLIPQFHAVSLRGATENAEKEAIMQEEKKEPHMEADGTKDAFEKRTPMLSSASPSTVQTNHIEMKRGTHFIQHNEKCVLKEEDLPVVQASTDLPRRSFPKGKKDVGTQLYTVSARTEWFSKIVFRRVRDRIAAKSFAKQIGVMGDAITTLSKDLLYLLALLVTDSAEVLRTLHPSSASNASSPGSAVGWQKTGSCPEATPASTLGVECSRAAVVPHSPLPVASSSSMVSPSSSLRISPPLLSTPTQTPSKRGTAAVPRTQETSATPTARFWSHSLPLPMPPLTQNGGWEDFSRCGDHRTPHPLFPSHRPVMPSISSSVSSSALVSSLSPPPPPPLSLLDTTLEKDFLCSPLSFFTLLSSLTTKTYATLLHFLPSLLRESPLYATTAIASPTASSIPTHARRERMQQILWWWATASNGHPAPSEATFIDTSVPAVLRKWVCGGEGTGGHPAGHHDTFFPGWICQCCRRAAKEMFHYDKSSRQLREVYAVGCSVPSPSFLGLPSLPPAASVLSTSSSPIARTEEAFTDGGHSPPVKAFRITAEIPTRTECGVSPSSSAAHATTHSEAKVALKRGKRRIGSEKMAVMREKSMPAPSSATLGHSTCHASPSSPEVYKTVWNEKESLTAGENETTCPSISPPPSIQGLRFDAIIQSHTLTVKNLPSGKSTGMRGRKTMTRE